MAENRGCRPILRMSDYKSTAIIRRSAIQPGTRKFRSSTGTRTLAPMRRPAPVYSAQPRRPDEKKRARAALLPRCPRAKRAADGPRCFSGVMGTAFGLRPGSSGPQAMYPATPRYELGAFCEFG